MPECIAQCLTIHAPPDPRWVAIASRALQLCQWRGLTGTWCNPSRRGSRMEMMKPGKCRFAKPPSHDWIFNKSLPVINVICNSKLSNRAPSTPLVVSISGIKRNRKPAHPPRLRKPWPSTYFLNAPKIFCFSLSASPTGVAPTVLASGSGSGFAATCSLPAPPRPVW